LIALGEDYFEFWNYIEVVCLTKEGLSQFIENLLFDQVTESIWAKVCDRLRGVGDGRLKSDRYLKLTGSEISGSCPEILGEFRDKQWRLLYRGSRDGFGSSDFHGKCDGQLNTLTVIATTKAFVFGGFTPIGWSSTNSWGVDNSGQSFLFTVKNAGNIAPRKFSLSSPSHAIYCNSGYGPTFGSGYDIYVAANCNANTGSYTNLGTDYVNDTGIGNAQVFTGEKQFTVQEIEVFAISL
jgi:hypothetical protein